MEWYNSTLDGLDGYGSFLPERLYNEYDDQLGWPRRTCLTLANQITARPNSAALYDSFANRGMYGPIRHRMAEHFLSADLRYDYALRTGRTNSVDEALSFGNMYNPGRSNHMMNTKVDKQKFKALYVRFVYTARERNSTFERLESEDYAGCELKDISMGLMDSPRHKVRVYLNVSSVSDAEYNNRTEEQRSEYNCTLTIYSNKEMDALMHRKLLAIFPALVQRFTTCTISDQTKEFCMALSAPNTDTFDNLMKTKFNITELLEKVRRDNFTQVFQGMAQRTLDSLTTQVRRVTNDITNYENHLTSDYAALRELQLRLAGFQMLNSTGDYESDVKYYCKNNNLIAIRPHDNGMRYTVKAPVLYYDESFAKKMFTEGSRFWDNNSARGTRAREVLKLLHDVFVERKFIMFFGESVDVDVEGAHRTGEIVTYADNPLNANPHHKHFNCFGNSNAPIARAFTNNDYITLLEQVLACVGNLNLADGVVFNKFFNDLCDNTDGTRECAMLACADDPNTLYSVEEIMKKVYEVK